MARFRFGDFVFDTQQQELCRMGTEIPLEPKAFQVLSYLLMRHDQAVSKEELLDVCWQGEIVTDSAIARCLKVVRQAVDDDGAQQHTIRTLRKYGYRFIAPVEVDGPPHADRPAPAKFSSLDQTATREIVPRIGAHLREADIQGARSAILMGNSTYPCDASLTPLQTPERDVEALADVLTHFQIASFQTVQRLHNASHRDGLDALLQLVQTARRDDVVLVFFSGHACLDQHGRLYLAFSNTRSQQLDMTALSFNHLKDALDTCQSTRMILILDCCFSRVSGEPIALQDLERQMRWLSSGRGKYLLHTAPTPCDAQDRQTEPHSPLTRHFIDGLRTGRADLAHTGWVTADQLYQYVLSNMLEENLPTPVKWDLSGKGGLILAAWPTEFTTQPHRTPSPSTTVKAHYDAMTQLLKRGDIIPCLGPYVAEPTAHIHPPTGTALAQRLAASAGFSDHTEALPLIAQKLQMIAGRGILYDNLRDIYQPAFNIYSPALIHRFLARLPHPLLILSTTYDTLIEDAFDDVGKDYVIVAHLLHADNLDRGKVVVQYSDRKDAIEKHLPQDLVIDLAKWSIIYKLHGTFGLYDPAIDEDLDSIVVTEEDYLTLVKRLDHPQSTIPNHIARQFKKRMFLFLGYQVREWHDRAMADVIQDKGNFRRIQPYVIHDHTTEFERLYWESKRVRLLETDVHTFIRELADTIGIDV